MLHWICSLWPASVQQETTGPEEEERGGDVILLYGNNNNSKSNNDSQRAGAKCRPARGKELELSGKAGEIRATSESIGRAGERARSRENWATQAAGRPNSFADSSTALTNNWRAACATDCSRLGARELAELRAERANCARLRQTRAASECARGRQGEKSATCAEFDCFQSPILQLARCSDCVADRLTHGQGRPDELWNRLGDDGEQCERVLCVPGGEFCSKSPLFRCQFAAPSEPAGEVRRRERERQLWRLDYIKSSEFSRQEEEAGNFKFCLRASQLEQVSICSNGEAKQDARKRLIAGAQLSRQTGEQRSELRCGQLAGLAEHAGGARCAALVGSARGKFIELGDGKSPNLSRRCLLLFPLDQSVTFTLRAAGPLAARSRDKDNGARLAGAFAVACAPEFDRRKPHKAATMSPLEGATFAPRSAHKERERESLYLVRFSYSCGGFLLCLLGKCTLVRVNRPNRRRRRRSSEPAIV